MNAAARALSQGGVFRGQYQGVKQAKPAIVVIALMLALLVSSLGLVYVKHLERQYTSQYQQLSLEYANLQLERGQLLLEKSTFAAPSTVHRKAVSLLGMHSPKQKSIIVISQ